VPLPAAPFSVAVAVAVAAVVALLVSSALTRPT